MDGKLKKTVHSKLGVAGEMLFRNEIFHDTGNNSYR